MISSKIIAVAAVMTLAACSSTSQGVALGVRGSPAWNTTAPKADIMAYYDHKRDYELCTSWQKHRDSPTLRANIADALERRGKPADMCYRPELDAMQAAAEASRPNSYVPPPAARKSVNCQGYTIGNITQTYCN
ncbi:hypothetical protein GR223_23515 [Rhizobium leguminosarum]|uniref:hypothetical protein n=1 Tax=Rhizobium ruizarguesonis TaxID=2081791 RepID=UPI0013DEC17F|nr:hypothetical protein [Rhizobium ruizarguesonis]NEJ88865.1 hypothetical protein [Rhizobium ruizarguesonis]